MKLALYGKEKQRYNYNNSRGSCILPRPYAMASAQLGQEMGDSASYVSRWTAVTAAKRTFEGGLCISVYLS